MSSASATTAITLSWFRRVIAALRGGYTRITLTQNEIKLDAAFGREPAIVRLEEIERIDFHRARLNSRLVFVIRNDEGASLTAVMSGLSVIDGDDLLSAIDAAGTMAASSFAARLSKTHSRAIDLLESARFIHGSEVEALHAEVLDVARTAPAEFVRERMSDEAARLWSWTQSRLDKEELISAQRAANLEFTAELVSRTAAKAYERALETAEQQLNKHFDGTQYVYDADTYFAGQDLECILRDFPSGDILDRISPSAAATRERLLPFVRLEALQERRLLANRYFTSSLTLRVAAESYSHALETLGERVRGLLSGESWLRASQAELPYEEIVGVVEDMPPQEIIDQITPAAALARERLMPLADEKRFEEARETVNERFAAYTRDSAIVASRPVVGRDLSEEQALAVVTDEDATLVLAGAGSGKTAVIVGKVAHLVENERALPSEILVLAYNRKAMEELEARLAPQYGAVSVRTFHSFGKRIVDGSTEVKRSVSKLATDDELRQKETQQYLQGLLGEPVLGDTLRHYLLYNRSPFRSPFEFATPGEYYAAAFAGQKRALSGDFVKSHEELQIANFLTSNGIEFEYERKYEKDTANREYRQYEPDFYLTEHDLYIEHFALDRDGRAPCHWPDEERERYERGVSWKRMVHEENNTRLLETYSWQRSEGILRAELERQLLEHGVELRSIEIEEIVERLSDEFGTTDVARLLDSFLDHQRNNNTTMEVLRERAQSAGDWERALAFLDVFEAHKQWYADALGEDMDFHDMIAEAAEELRQEQWRHPYKYVLVDEFQDISRGRMALLEAMRRPGLAYFLVGDDWQSINRFAGSDVGLLNCVGDLLGTVKRRELGQTFRYGAKILEPSSRFVQQNPAQSQRELKPNVSVTDEGIIVRALVPPEDGPAQQNLQKIQDSMSWRKTDAEQKQLDKAKDAAEWETVLHTIDIVLNDMATLTEGQERQQSVLLLGRYNHNNPERFRTKPRMEFSTVHSAKGREADFVIVLDLKDGRSGFPSQREDDPLLDLVAPPLEPFSFAEERRLFYVALTRARRGTYLLVDAESQSRFVTELLAQDQGLIRRLGEIPVEAAERCHRCRGGTLVISRTGKNMRCSNYRFCNALYPRCECGQGYMVHDGETVTCTNEECEEISAPCPKCRIGTLTRRSSYRGEFWGCSEYGRVPPCDYTQNKAPGSERRNVLSGERRG